MRKCTGKRVSSVSTGSVMESFKKRKPASSVMDCLGSTETSDMYRVLHDNSGPYMHSVLDPLCEDETMRKVHHEVTTNLTATFKETDLFKVYQTGDLGNLSEKDALARKMPELMRLRSRIYSPEFRKFVQDITGCRELTDRTDCSTNAYAEGCHLMCHDDVIGTRCISYIIYLTDPDEPWKEDDGGALELYPLDGDDKTSPDRQGVPAAIPTHSILPKFNTMALFMVQPGRSYHAVQEVFAAGKPRLSISGWYHAASPPPGSDLASLKQIMSKGSDSRPFIPIAGDIFEDIEKFEAELETNDSAELDDSDKDDEIAALSDADLAVLRPLINSTYLEAANMRKIRSTFNRDSSIQLHSFLQNKIGKRISKATTEADRSDALGATFPPPLDYAVGVGEGWELIGPPHLRRFLRFESKSAEKLKSSSSKAGELLSEIQESLFHSAAFHRYLYLVTGMKPCNYRDEVRRFRPGLDYTIAHHGTMVESSPSIDTTLCFCNRREEEDAENWESGDIGGFECYMAADADADADATAEVYKVENEEDDGQLISVSSGDNVLNIILRDRKVMRFIKFVSHNAPGSRWDVSAEFDTTTDA